MMKKIALFTLTVLLSTSVATGQTFTGMFWNIHSGDSDANTIGSNMAQKVAVDFWGLSEVPSDPDFLKSLEEQIEEATGIDYFVQMSTKGGEDRLAILFNSERLESEPYGGTATGLRDLGNNFFELPSVNTSGTVRPSLGIQLNDKEGQSVIVLVNHWKAKGDQRSRGIRQDQAEATNAFLNQTHDIPVFLAGDHNIPIVDGGTGDQQLAFETLTRKFVYLVPDNERHVGSFRSGSVLDSVFLANELPDWESSTTIMNRFGNIAARTRSFRDNSRTADHRPIRLSVVGNRTDRAAAIRAEIIATRARLERLEEQLRRLEIR